MKQILIVVMLVTLSPAYPSTPVIILTEACMSARWNFTSDITIFVTVHEVPVSHSQLR